MKKKIGKVTLDYTFYKGKDLYTDGEIEDILLQIVKENKQNKILYESNQWPILYHLSNIRENLLDWYPFEEKADILEVGSGCGAITGLLSRKANSVTCIELSEKRSMINAYKNKDCENVTIMLGNFQDIQLERKFDYVTLIGVWEYAGLYVSGINPYEEMLQMIKQFLKEDGKIIVAIENKMGMKYFNGAREDHTGKFYGSINDYIGDKNVRTFSKPEIINILERVGIDKYCFYYPMPDYKIPDSVYSESLSPKPGNIRYYGQEYSMSRIYNFYDATAFDQVCADGIFSYFANSFLFVCGENEEKCIYAKYSRERKPEFRICTIISEHNGKRFVEKKALSEEAKFHVLQMKTKEEKWKNSGMPICYVSGHVENDTYAVPYIEGVSLDEYLYEWRNNPDEFIKVIKDILEKYLTPQDSDMVPFKVTEKFKEIFGDIAPKDAKSLRVTNMDILFSNLKLTDDKEIYNFDYEWIFDFEIPFDYVLWRALDQLYSKYMAYLKRKISLNDYLNKLGIVMENIPTYENMERNFAEYVFGIGRKEEYTKRYRKNVLSQTIN